MPNQPPLNSDALAAAERWMQEKSATFGLHWKNAKPIIEAYLAVAQPVLDETALANLITWKSLPFGATQFVKLDANAAHKVIELLKPHLAVAQPEVTSVEELDQLPVESVLLDADNCVMQILHNGEQYLNGDPFREYCMVGDTRDYEADEVALPARVLYRPEVKP